VARAGSVTSCETTVPLSYGGGAESAPYLFAPNTTGGNTATSGFCFRNVTLPPAGTTDTYTVVGRDASPLASGGGTVVEIWQFQVTKP